MNIVGCVMKNLKRYSVSVILAITLIWCVILLAAQYPPVLAQTGQPTPTLQASTNQFAGLSIAELAARTYGGGQVVVDQTLATSTAFTRYLIHYPSDGLTIYGFMDVPQGTPRKGKAFPVIIALHGYIDPGIYQTLDYTTIYADALARAGYLVLHPTLRNYPPSDSGPNILRVGFAVDVLNLAAIVRTQAGQPGPLQAASPTAIGLWGHSMGGGVSIRAMTVDPLIRAVVLYAPINGDDRLNAERWYYRHGQYDIKVPDEVFGLVSPQNFYDRVQAAVSIHQGLADTTVPPTWSADLCARLQALHKSVECFTYPGEPHTFVGVGEQLFVQRMIAFFDAHLIAS